jgi:NTE family protein
MNAAVLASGLAVGGRGGARNALADFWYSVVYLASLGPLQPTAFDRLMGVQSLETSPAFVQFDLMTRLFSPYQLNPFNINPLRSVLYDTVDFDAIRKAQSDQAFPLCNHVRTGKIRMFDDEIGPNTVLAPACLPFLFQAIEIGGHMGNPAIFP